MSETLPWQAAQWRRVRAACASRRLAHALLLRGPSGVGKRVFAERLSAMLLCEAPTLGDRPCGQCRGCHLLLSGTHPDVATLAPAEGRSSVGVDQVRAAIGQSGLTRHYADARVVLIAPAESLTGAAANSLLKTLEEPPGPTIFLLVSHHSAALPSTIRSRCQILDFPVPAPNQARDWLIGKGVPESGVGEALAAAHGAPLAALALHRGGGIERRRTVLRDLEALAQEGADPLIVAKGWKDQGAEEVLHWLIGRLNELIRLKSRRRLPIDTGIKAGIDTAIDSGAGSLATRKQSSKKSDLRELYRVLDRCLEGRRSFARQQHPNELLLLEGIAIEWARGRITS